MSKPLKVLLLIILLSIGVYLYLFRSKENSKTDTTLENVSNTNTRDASLNTTDAPRVSVLTTKLEIPWALVFLPNGDMLVTERAGWLKLIKKSDSQNPVNIAQIAQVKADGEGGLLGITLHPDFISNKFIYLYYTYSSDGRNTLNRVVRYVYDNAEIKDATTILDAIPGALFHNGGRLKFGSDKYLYITTGDAQEPSLSQDTSSLAGKILRVTDDGKAAPDNPFNNEVYSYGHRNPQGLAWDGQNRLWAPEHGSSAADEVNLIKPGSNYGWPTVRGDQNRNGLTAPVIHSDRDTWAPSGLAFLNDKLYFAGLRGQALFEATIQGEKLQLRTLFKGEYGRLRDVVVGPDNLLYVLTSNRDGRGSPKPDDDKILIINPSKL